MLEEILDDLKLVTRPDYEPFTFDLSSCTTLNRDAVYDMIKNSGDYSDRDIYEALEECYMYLIPRAYNEYIKNNPVNGIELFTDPRLMGILGNLLATHPIHEGIRTAMNLIMKALRNSYEDKFEESYEEAIKNLLYPINRFDVDALRMYCGIIGEGLIWRIASSRSSGVEEYISFRSVIKDMRKIDPSIANEQLMINILENLAGYRKVSMTALVFAAMNDFGIPDGDGIIQPYGGVDTIIWNAILTIWNECPYNAIQKSILQVSSACLSLNRLESRTSLRRFEPRFYRLAQASSELCSRGFNVF